MSTYADVAEATKTIETLDDNASMVTRELLMDVNRVEHGTGYYSDAIPVIAEAMHAEVLGDDSDLTVEVVETLARMIAALDTESLTEARLAYSLCPLHGCDYAICFDDEDAECAAIRIIHPSYDS